MKKSSKADLFLLGLAFIWGATFGLVKNALNDISPLVFNSVRFTLASILFWIIFRDKLGSFEKPLIKAGLLTGLFLALGYGFQTIGLYYTTASKSAFITGFSVILVPLFIIIIEKIIPKPTVIFSAFLALIGLRLLTMSGSNGGINIGDLLTVMCAAAYALHLICIEIFTKKYDYIKLSFLQLIMTAILNLLAIPIFETPRFNFTLTVFWTLLITSIFCSAFAIYILNRVQRYTTAAHAAIIFTMEPVFAYLIAYLFYGEKLGIIGTIGAGLILMGMILSELKRAK
ncbi:MAG: DMT family transporter [Candidatus Helarchaeota archaeon]|nr:DMT family transporter [Candidatus Helarchaeota archaeon]